MIQLFACVVSGGIHVNATKQPVNRLRVFIFKRRLMSQNPIGKHRAVDWEEAGFMHKYTHCFINEL